MLRAVHRFKTEPNRTKPNQTENSVFKMFEPKTEPNESDRFRFNRT